MEKQQTDFELMSQYSVRISRADNPSALLGTGTLLIRQEFRTAWLLTCAHVFFPNKQGSEPLSAVNVEYAYLARKGGVHAPRLLRLSGRGPIAEVMAGILQWRDDVAADYVCLDLGWEAWMAELPDTTFAEPVVGTTLKGAGFPQWQNDDYNILDNPINSTIRPLSMQVSAPGAKGWTSLKYEGFPAVHRDAQMEGLSGAALYDAAGQLVCMISAPRGEDSGYFEVKAFTLTGLERTLEKLRRTRPIVWESFSLAWCIRDPSPGQPVLASLRHKINLFYLLGGIRGAAVVLLLDHRGEELKSALELLDDVVPFRNWERFSIAESYRFDPDSMEGGGAVISMTFQAEDWSRAEEFLNSRWEEAGLLLLFHVDISPCSKSTLTLGNSGSDDLRAAMEDISWALQERPYYLLFTTCFADFPSAARQEEVSELLDRAKEDPDPFQYVLTQLDKHPCIYRAVMQQAARSQNHLLRMVGCRLAIRYGLLLGRPSICQLFRAGDTDFIQGAFHNSLEESEKTALLGQLVLSAGSDADTILSTILDNEFLDTSSADLTEDLRLLTKEKTWTREFLESRFGDVTHDFFEQVLICLNDPRRTQSDYKVFLSVLKSWNDRSFYWKALLRSRWGVLQLSLALGGDDGKTAAMLLDPKPDTSDTTASDYAAAVREQLFP